MSQNINNEEERAAQEYVDTTLRSSHYNQTQRIEDATDGNTRKLSTIHKIILSSIFCIVATYLCTGYVIYKHGSFLFSGDSIENLRQQIELTETLAGDRYEFNRNQAAAFRRTRNDVEDGLRDQIEKLNAELKSEKNYRIRVEQQIEGLQLQLKTIDVKVEQLCDEDLNSFAEIIENLPESKKAAWIHFTKQIKKDGEKKVHDYLRDEEKNNTKKNLDDSALHESN
jgi:vacuolar-type H+-ATPase subunit I/STV1